MDNKTETSVTLKPNNSEISEGSVASKSTESKPHHESTQLKLLSLAKRFKLDGALTSQANKLPLPERAQERALHSHLLKQHNIEAIISKAMHYSSTDEITDKVDQDWFSHFIELAENISNKTMQELWAKILISEISHAGSFSLKSLKTFHLMSVHEAKVFAKACSLAVTDRTKSHFRIISGAYKQPGLFNFFSTNREQKVNLSSIGLNYSELLMLADNHLIFINEAESNRLNKHEEITFIYNGKPLTFSPKKNESLLNFYKFTQVGTELARLMIERKNEEYLTELNNTVGTLFNINSL